MTGEKVKLTYFNIAGVAEKVRLALVLTNTPFEDKRIAFQEWGELKKNTKYGTLPMMEVDGKPFLSQSDAMLRWAAAQGDGSLCPEENKWEMEELMCLADDLTRAWSPALYVGMRPRQLGYPDDWPAEEKAAKVKFMRERFLAEDLPKYMGFLQDQLARSGGPFLCGKCITIADLKLYPQVLYFTTGTGDYVPKDSLDAYPVIKQWLDSIRAVPEIASYYASKN